MKICPLMSNSESSINCTPDCSWFDAKKSGCIVISIKSLLDDILNDTSSMESNLSWIESNIPHTTYRD